MRPPDQRRPTARARDRAVRAPAASPRASSGRRRGQCRRPRPRRPAAPRHTGDERRFRRQSCRPHSPRRDRDRHDRSIAAAPAAHTPMICGRRRVRLHPASDAANQRPVACRHYQGVEGLGPAQELDANRAGALADGRNASVFDQSSPALGRKSDRRLVSSVEILTFETSLRRRTHACARPSSRWR